MKKTLMIIVAILMAIGVRAQQLDLGMSIVPTASTVNFDAENIAVSTLLLAHVNFSTKKSYHVLAYNFNGAAIMMLHGWTYRSDQDVYLSLSKNLKDAEGYLGIGWEHTVSCGGFTPSAFIEIGTNYAFSESYFSVGIFAPLSWTVWKKK